MIIDTHSHIIAPDKTKYPLQPYGLDQGTGDDRRPASWFEDVPASAEQLLEVMDGAGVDGALLVQAMGAYSYDNAYVVDSAAAYPDRFSSVVIVDMEAPDPAGALRSWAERGARAVRLFTITKPLATWLDEPRSFPVWETAADLGMPVVIAMLPNQLPQLRNILQRFPDIPVALDHFAFPNLEGGPPYVNAPEHFALVDFPNLNLKVSSNLLERAEEASGARQFMETLVERFGSDRLMWGSDYSQTHDRSYADLLGLAQEATAGLSSADRAAYLGGTALRLWPELSQGKEA